MPTKKTNAVKQSKAKTAEPTSSHQVAVTPDPEHGPHHQHDHVAPATDRTQKSGRRAGRLVLLIVIIVVGLGIVAGGVFAAGLYRFGLQGRWVDVVNKTLPFPVAIANGRMIRYADYTQDLSTLRHFYDANAESQGQVAPSGMELKQNVLNRLVYDTVLQQLVREYAITVDDKELNDQLDAIAAETESGKREDVSTLLQQLYGLNESEFKQKIILPVLWFQKVEEAVAKDAKYSGDVKKRAEDVLAEVKKGDKSFEELAQQYSDDSTASVGGDLGFFGKDVMVKEFEDAAFALPVGGVSDLVKTDYGYHIIKVEEKVQDQEKGEEVRARHILLRTKTADDLLQERMTASKVSVFLKGFRWDAKNGWVATDETSTSNTTTEDASSTPEEASPDTNQASE